MKAASRNARQQSKARRGVVIVRLPGDQSGIMPALGDPAPGREELRRLRPCCPRAPKAAPTRISSLTKRKRSSSSQELRCRRESCQLAGSATFVCVETRHEAAAGSCPAWGAVVTIGFRTCENGGAMPRSIPPPLSLVLTYLRAARGWTQRDLAVAAGVPRQ